MIFADFSRIEEGDVILFSTKTPIEYVEKIKYYKDNESGSFEKKEFRWSFNQTYWSSWEVLNQGNVSNIKIRNNRYLFLEVRYVKKSDTDNVTSFSLSYNPLTSSERTTPSDDGPTPNSTPIPTDYGSTPERTSTTTIVNAETLCGKPCDYYLWRKNHKGEQPISSVTDLQTVLDDLAASIRAADIAGADNVVGDGIGVFYENFDKTLYFRRINGADGINVVEGNNGLINLSVDLNYIKTDSSIIELYDFYSILHTDLNDLSIYVDNKFTNIDNQFTNIGGQFDDVDSSLLDLYNKYWNADSSIIDLYSKYLGNDSSITDLYFKYNEADSSIIQIFNFYTSLQSDLNDLSTYIDSQLYQIDSSLAQILNFYTLLQSDLNDLSIYVDSTFTTINSSINDLYTITDNLDSSISELHTILGTYFIKDAENVGGGTGQIYKGIDSSGTAQFRTITGAGDVSIVTSGDNVSIFVAPDVSIQFDPWVDPDPISADVGGLKGGDYVQIGDTPRTVLEDILYEYFPPNINLELIPSANTYYEKWVDAPSIDVSGNFNNNKFKKVRIYDASLYINGIGDPAFPHISYSDVESGSFSWSDPSPPYGVNWDDVTYTVKIFNKVNSMEMQSADVSASIKFVNPYYYGIVSDSINSTNITESDIKSLIKIISPEQTNLVEFSVPANTKIKFVYAYPDEYAELRNIFDVKNDFNVSSSFDLLTLNLNGVGASPSPIPYKVYLKNHWISFTSDVSVFRLIFNI